MIRSHIFWKLYVVYVVLILISGVLVGVLVAQRTEQESLDDIRSSLEAQAVLLREMGEPSLRGWADSSLQERVQAVGRETHTRLTVIRTDGVVIADSDENPAGMDNHGNRPEILAARSGGRGAATRFSDTIGAEMMYLALSVEAEGQVVGYVRTSLPLSRIGQRLGRLRAAVAAGVGVSVLVALMLGFLVARGFTRPLGSMARAADAIASGDYEQRLPAARRDEIGELARALNRMAASCKNRMDTIVADRGKLLTILEGMVEGVVAVDRDEHVVHMNTAAGRILGVSPEASHDRPIWEVTRITEVSTILAETLRGRTDVEGDIRRVAQSRNQFVRMHASPLHNGEGDLVGAVVALHDVSELHRLETVRRDFVANASHELKTPITAIQALVDTLIDDDRMAREGRERFLVKIRNQSARLSLLVSDLLTLSRLESERDAVEHFSVNLCDVVLGSVQAVQPAAEERGVNVSIEVPESAIDLVADEEALGQIVANLLDNALKYTAKGGQVWVRVRTEDGCAVIEVEDTGIGIQPRDLGRIFERFYRADKARSRELGGTGLGLSIVKHVALAHGGRVSVDSVPGTGSTFRVHLPLDPVSA